MTASLHDEQPNARLADVQPAPFAYAYRYPYMDGSTVIRFGTEGREINGSAPIEAIPLYTNPALARDARQEIVANWCALAFGADQASSIEQRGIRLLEEAIELYQACSGTQAMAENLVAYIFQRPAGTIEQELGGVGVTTLALAQAAGLSADTCEANEVDRVLAKPLAHFAARNQAKNDAGFRAGRPIGLQNPEPPRPVHYVEDERAPGKLAAHPRKREE